MRFYTVDITSRETLKLAFQSCEEFQEWMYELIRASANNAENAGMTVTFSIKETDKK